MTRQSLRALDDDGLAKEAARGDRLALEILLNRHTPSAVQIAYLVLGRQQDALDAAQTALIQISHDLPNRWGGRSFSAWLRACVFGAAANHRKNEARRAQREQSVAILSKEVCMSPHEVLEQQEVRNALREELGQLNSETAAAITLHYLEDLSQTEVAMRFGWSVDVCKQRLHRGRERLREQLRRRGITLSATVLLSSLKTLFGEAKVWAGGLETRVYSDMVQETLILQFKQPISLESISRPTSSSAAVAADHSPLAPPTARGSTDKGKNERWIGTMLGVLCVFMIGGATLIWARIDEPTQKPRKMSQSPLPRALPETVAAFEKNSATTQKKALEANPRWQPPRFIKGAYAPLSLSAAGAHVALLAIDLDQKHRLLLFESSDAGITWTHKHTFEGYAYGRVAADTEGNTYFLLNRTLGRVEYLIRGSDGSVGSPEVAWSEVADFQNVMSPTLIRVKTATWAFYNRNRHIEVLHDKSKKPSLEVAFAGGRSVPRPIALELDIGSGGSMGAANWAADRNSAGFVLAYRDEPKLRHHYTLDSGATWNTAEIPFAHADQSFNGKFENVLPWLLSRAGQRLVLLVSASFYRSPSQVIDLFLFRGYLLTSYDLGRTWSSPIAVTDLTNTLENSLPSHAFHAHASGTCFGYNRGDLMKPFSLQRPLSIRWLKAEGEVLMDIPTLEPFSAKAKGFVIGGDEDSVHVAMLVSETAEQNWLTIVSYSKGSWVPSRIRPNVPMIDRQGSREREDF